MAAAYSPMDETLSRVALDISGRPWLVWKAEFTTPRLGEWDTELIEHWFHSFAQAGGHHAAHRKPLWLQQSPYRRKHVQGLARALRQAVEIDPRKADAIPSTKGML
jgi:imidazoleglycerol-phosphate dehydratase